MKLKKSILTVIALLALCAIVTACSAPSASPLPSQSAEPTAPAASDSPASTATAEPTQEPAATPDAQQFNADMEAMRPILDTVVLTMGAGENAKFDPQDAEFFWTGLYLMGVNWSASHPLIEQAEEAVVVPAQAMEDIARSAFGSDANFPQMPDDLSQVISYDIDSATYSLSYSDRGSAQTNLHDIAIAEDGTVTVQMDLISAPDELLGTFVFTLAADEAARAAGSPFAYQVVSVELLPKA